MLDIDILVPGGVLCMYSAWEHYELTTQIPSAFCIAIPRKRKLVLPEFPPITLYYWSDHLLEFGTTIAEVHGHKVHVTDLERSVCDAVKYRNKIGLDVCAEILKTYLHVTCDSVVDAKQRINPLLKNMVWNYTIECPNFKILLNSGSNHL
jgi:predicted transcriptional regulator of viral defense system